LWFEKGRKRRKKNKAGITWKGRGKTVINRRVLNITEEG
jgi:hypothetical protein